MARRAPSTLSCGDPTCTICGEWTIPKCHRFYKVNDWQSFYQGWCMATVTVLTIVFIVSVLA